MSGLAEGEDDGDDDDDGGDGDDDTVGLVPDVFYANDRRK